MFHRSTVIFGILSLAASAAGPAMAGPYYVTDLGVVAGSTGFNSYAMAVNDYGEVAGASSTVFTTAGNSSRYYATIYQNGAWSYVPTAWMTGNAATYANGITDSGLVSGGHSLTDSFVYNMNTAQFTNIENQPGVCSGVSNRCGCDSYWTADIYETPTPMNSSGQIVGHYGNSAGGLNLFAYSGGMNGSTSVVTTPATDQDTSIGAASAISNSGVVVGNYAIGMNPNPVGFYSLNGTEYDMSNMAYPEGINGTTVVGADAPTSNGLQIDAAVYTLGNSSATYLGVLPGDEGSLAYGLSNSGTIIGTSFSSTLQRAFVDANGTMTDLNTQIIGNNPFSDLTSALGISANGEYIVGYGTPTTNSNYVQGFLLTAAIPGDANGDGKVDINDLTIVLAHYGQTGQSWSTGDFVGDGKVDINDLTIVLAHYGDTSAAAAGSLSAAPEPAGIVLLAGGGLAMLAAALRRRKSWLKL